MKTPALLLILIMGFVSRASSQTFTDLWFLGVENNTQSDFEQENSVNRDYYVENGDYTLLFPAGKLWTGGMEPLNDGINGNDIGFPRAVTNGVTTNHIYFQLSAGEADPAAVFKYRTRAILPKANTTNDLSFQINGFELHAEPAVGPAVPLEIEFTFTGADGVAEGPNVFTVERTGGTLDGGSAWIQFDHHQLSIDLESIGCQAPICSYSADTLLINPGGSATLSWLIANTATASIDNNVGDLAPLTTNGIGTTTVSPTENTTYTLSSSFDGDDDSQAVTIEVVNIVSFTSNLPTIFSGDMPTLSWQVDPAASVDIEADQGPSPGNVDANTVGGFGSISVSPVGTTTYTLTSTRGGDIESTQVTVTQIGITSFTSDDLEIFPGEPAPTLSWQADPAATLTITADNAPDPGNVDALTFGGFGSLLVDPVDDGTTYTLTSDVGGILSTAEVTVEVNNYAQLWQIGDDNNGNGELEQERSGMRDFYLEDGDYTGLIPAGLDWMNGPEILNNNVNGDTIGMPRAFTTGFTEIDIYFQLGEEHTTPDTRFRFTLDIQSVRTIANLPSTHDVSFSVNNTPVHAVTDNTLQRIRDTFTAAEVGAQTGPNVISIRRDGGVIPAWPAGTSNPNASWIVFDYYRLEAIPAPETDFRITDISLDDIFGEVTVTWNSTTGSTYRVETSLDMLEWDPAATGWPVGGATGGSTSYTDDNALQEFLYYRVARE